MSREEDYDMPVVPVWDVNTALNEEGKVEWAHIMVCHAFIMQHRDRFTIRSVAAVFRCHPRYRTRPGAVSSSR